MDLERVQNEQRLTIVGLWGRDILKPQTSLYPNLPELEDVSMHLAESMRITTYEQIAKGILRYSAAPQLDLVNFWEIVLFSWFTGNSDIPLENANAKKFPGPIPVCEQLELQCHGDPLEFRNLAIREL